MIDFAHFIRSTELAAAMMLLELLEKLYLLLHDAEAIVEIVVTRTSMLKIHDEDLLAPPFLRCPGALHAKLGTERHHVLEKANRVNQVWN